MGCTTSKSAGTSPTPPNAPPPHLEPPSAQPSASRDSVAAPPRRHPGGALPPVPAPPASLSQLVAPPPAAALAAGAATAGSEEEPAYGLSPADAFCGRGREGERLAALRALQLAGRPGGPRFGAITSLLKAAFGVPVANVFLFDENTVLPVPDSGAADEEWLAYPRCESACRWVVGESEAHEMLIVEDLKRDCRFAGTLYVAGPPHVRFYASTPLVSTDSGLRYGTLCLLDFQPRRFKAAEYQMLPHLAEVVVREAERDSLLRFRQIGLEAARSGVRRLVRGLDCFKEGILVCDVEEGEGWQVQYGNVAAAVLLGVPQDRLAGAAFWELLRVSGDGVGSTREDVEAAVHGGDSCKLTCRMRLAALPDPPCAGDPASPAASSAAAAGTPGSGGGGSGGTPQLSAELRRWDSCAGPGGGGELESVLSGRLAPEALLQPASSSQLPAVSPPPDFIVTLTPASAPEFRPDEPPIGIPVSGTSWHEASASFSDSAAAAGGARPTPGTAFPGNLDPADSLSFAAAAAGAGQARGGGPADGCAPAHPAPSSLWFATITAAAPHAAGGSGAATLSGSASATAAIEYLRPKGLDEVQLGPLLGAGASGRTYRGTWYGSAVAVKIINVWEEAGEEGQWSPDASNGGGGGGGAGSAPAERSGGGGMHAAVGSGGVEHGGSSGAAPVLEALLSRALSHPHIVPTHAWGISDGGAAPQGGQHRQVWIVQSLCCLGTLQQAIDTGRFQDAATQGPHLRAILQTASEVAGALAFLHSVGVVHGDLTGNNILLSPTEDGPTAEDGRGFVAMLADFGLSRPTSSPLSAVPRGTFGTVSHMPPELIERDELLPVGDSFSFGVVLWELMAGRRAWRGLGPLQIIHAVTVDRRTLAISPHWPPGIKALLKSCLASDPAQRPSAADILRRLQDWEQLLPES